MTTFGRLRTRSVHKSKGIIARKPQRTLEECNVRLKELEEHETNMVPEESTSKHPIRVHSTDSHSSEHWPGCWMVHLPCAIRRIERLERLLIVARRREYGRSNH